MSLQKEIKNQLKDAMLKRETVRVGVIRGLLASFTNELVSKGRKPEEELTDEEVLTVIRRHVKQRKDSIEQFRKGNREDLAANEEAELKILGTYLPQQMSREEIAVIAAREKAKLGLSNTKDMGKLMAAVMKELKGKADGLDVKAVVDSLFRSENK